MSKINELIKELCPNGVKYRTLENCCNILDNKRKPIKRPPRAAVEEVERLADFQSTCKSCW